MIELFDKKSGQKIGQINEEQLDFIIDHLEDESGERLYYRVDKPTLRFLADRGLDPDTVELLTTALGKRKTLDFEYHIDDEVDFDYDEE